jgi:glycosyltransferase involved in cell wall biosynthesis
MRFVFYHHQPHGPFSLGGLDAGTPLFAATVSRLRLLFWLAARGHGIQLFGNVESGEWKGVRATAGSEGLAAQLADGRVEEPVVLVVNNVPSNSEWDRIRSLKRPGVLVFLWAAGPFGAEWTQRAATREIDRVVCISNFQRDIYRVYPGFRRLEVSYMGVDTDLLAATPATKYSGPTVLFTSIPRRTKGLDHLLRAWSLVRRAVPEARLRVCGSAQMHLPGAVVGRTGILDSELEDEFSSFFGGYPASAESAGIELVGARPLTEVYGDLKGAVVAVVNCNWHGSLEMFCRSAVEAQMAGVPVVGAASGALPEVVVDGRTGLLAHSEDSTVIAEIIIRLLRDKALCTQMAAAGPTWARPLAEYETVAPDWEAMVHRARTDASAPAVRRQPYDLLRQLGYGRARLAARSLLR